MADNENKTGIPDAPSEVAEEKDNPTTDQPKKNLPSAEQRKKRNPKHTDEVKENPVLGHPENTVLIGNVPIEIKPTKFKYERNGTATFYQVLEQYPIGIVLRMTEDQIGDGRDGDKAVFDWLIAVTDDEELIKKYYNDFDQNTIDKLVEIYKRVNHIKEKEERLKNLMAPKKGA